MKEGIGQILAGPVPYGLAIDPPGIPVRTMPPQKPRRSKQDYGTPPELLDEVRRALGIHDFYRDLAASTANAVCPCYYTEEQNALVQDWATPNANWNWCNPPFARMAPWVEKAYEEMIRYGAQTIMLTPAGVGSNWFAAWGHQKCRVWFVRPRLTFVGEKDPYPKDLLLLQYGRAVLRGYGCWKWR